jgi:hypothetical protein
MGFKVMPELWFVAYNVVAGQFRAACYLCGWWGEFTEDETQAHRDLDKHRVTDQHNENAFDVAN